MENVVMAKDEKNISKKDMSTDPEIRKKQQSPNDPTTKVKDGTNDSIGDDEDIETEESANQKRKPVQENLPSDEQVPNPSKDARHGRGL